MGNLTTASHDYEQFFIPITICWLCFRELLSTHRRGLPAWRLHLQPTKDTPPPPVWSHVLRSPSPQVLPGPCAQPLSPCPALRAPGAAPWPGCLSPTLPRDWAVTPAGWSLGRGRAGGGVVPSCGVLHCKLPRCQAHTFQTTQTLLIRALCQPPAQKVTPQAWCLFPGALAGE